MKKFDRVGTSTRLELTWRRMNPDLYICVDCTAICNEAALVDHAGHAVSRRGGMVFDFVLTEKQVRAIYRLLISQEVGEALPESGEVLDEEFDRLG